MFSQELLDDDMVIFLPDDAVKHLVEEYKARKARERDHPQGNEGGTQPNNESRLGALMSNTRAKIKDLGNHLGALINKSKSSPSGMPQGPGGIGVKPIFAGSSL